MSELYRVAFAVPRAEAEIARAWLLERFPAGFAEHDVGGSTELVVYTDAAHLDELLATYPQASSEPVAAGWEDRWKEFHRPALAGGLWIGPPWIPQPHDAVAVVVDPGRAFGTGAHPTTRACIDLLSRLERGSLLDAGCGSGVVAVAAVRLGFAPVKAVDIDPVAVEVARETARANGVATEAWCADVLVDELPAADVVVANIELGVVEQLLARIAARTAVTSGYLASERPEVPGWHAAERIELEGWAADVVARPQ